MAGPGRPGLSCRNDSWVLLVTVKRTQRAAPASARAASAEAWTAAAVRSRVRGEDSRPARSSSIACTPFSILRARAAASRSCLPLSWIHTTRYPSAEGHGAWQADQTWSGSPIRPGARCASAQSGWWSCIQARNAASSLRLRGSTVMNRPPPRSMWPIASAEASLQSATYRKPGPPVSLTSASQVGMWAGSSLVLPSASRQMTGTAWSPVTVRMNTSCFRSGR